MIKQLPPWDAGPPPAVLVWSGKGGVGKSTVAAHLAVELAAQGTAAGYLDADLHGPSAAELFAVGERHRVRNQKIIPVARHGIGIVSTSLLADPHHAYVWRGALLRGALRQLTHDSDWAGREVLVVDMPPGTGEVQMAVLEELTCLAAVIVTTPHDLSVADLRRSLRMLADTDVPVVAAVENMAEVTCPSCAHAFRPFSGDAGRQLLALFPDADHIRLPLAPAAVPTFPEPGTAERLRPAAQRIAKLLANAASASAGDRP